MARGVRMRSSTLRDHPDVMAEAESKVRETLRASGQQLRRSDMHRLPLCQRRIQRNSLSMAYDMLKRAKLRCMHLLEKTGLYGEGTAAEARQHGKTEYTQEEQMDGAICICEELSLCG